MKMLFVLILSVLGLCSAQMKPDLNPPLEAPFNPHWEAFPVPLEKNANIFAALLSYGPLGDASIMGLTFHSSNDTFKKYPDYKPTVMWWSATDVERRHVANCITSEPRFCFTESPLAHYCNMTRLTAATKYFYTVGDDTVGRSAPISFKSPPAIGTKDPLTLTGMIYGDMGVLYSNYTRARLAKLQDEGEFDFVIHNGDISYADQFTRGDRAKERYNDWMDLLYANVTAYGSHVPYMFSLGNHENICDYMEYKARTAMMPWRGSNSTDPAYYSYTVGQTHIIALAGERGYFNQHGTATPELLWLEQDLANAAAARDRGEITFILTHVHYPADPTGYCTTKIDYCCANGKNGSTVGLRSSMEGQEHFEAMEENQTCVDDFMTPLNKVVEDMFVKYGVDMHMTAHQHVYERTTPIYRYQAFGNNSETFPTGNDGSVFVNPKYPINMNNGCPGDMEIVDVWMPRPDWSVGLRTNGTGTPHPNSKYSDWGVVKLTMTTGVDNGYGGMASLNLQYIDGQNGTTLDEMTLYK